jgi:hypothetical protein
VAVVVLWVRSYCVSDLFWWGRPSWAMMAVIADGEWRLEHLYPVRIDSARHYSGFAHHVEEATGRGDFPDRVPGENVHLKFRGFALVTGERWGDEHFALFLPSWFLAAVLAVPVLLRASTLAQRRVPGQCRRCGYDLRATPDRCPECGTIPAANSAR